MEVRVVGPDAPGPSVADLRRLFRGHRLTPSRRARLTNSGRAVAHCGGRIVGLAAYERFEAEVHVHEFGIDDQASCGAGAVIATLLDALEVACLAGGGRRLVLTPRGQVDDRLLAARGFRPIGHGSPHGFEKRFSA